MKRFRKLSLVLLVTCLGLMLASCGKKENDKKGDAPKEVRIGIIRVPNDKQVAISKNYFDTYFKEKGIKTKFMFFDSGVAANQAFASNSIDFAEMGYTNGVVALSTGIPVNLIWIHEILGTNEALVVHKDSAIDSVKELKGKKIATPFSSTSHFSLLQCLKEAGIEKDVELLDMETKDIVAAWERGDIDAAYTWEPTLSTIKETGKVLVDSKELAEKGHLTANIDLVHEDFAKKYPELVEDYLLSLNKGATFYKEHPKEAAKACAHGLDISEEEAIKQMEGTKWLTFEEELSTDYLGTTEKPGQFNTIFYETAVFLKEQGSIQEIPSKEAIKQFIQPKYIEAAQKKE
ncbi:MAG: aliphatic sulfonate ABC transporter substrate-binding protein [Vagococcus sp.]|uniref:taurine ABC transporter substrate-binding protein n=1 Tax=Vagococcus sp. TaxID=1933889 RepID=UPI002FCACDDB